MSSELVEEVKKLRHQCGEFTRQFAEYGYLDISQLEAKKYELTQQLVLQESSLESLKKQHELQRLSHSRTIENDKRTSIELLGQVEAQRNKAQSAVVNTDELAILQDELAGELLEFSELPEAVEYRQSLTLQTTQRHQYL